MTVTAWLNTVAKQQNKHGPRDKASINAEEDTSCFKHSFMKYGALQNVFIIELVHIYEAGLKTNFL